MPVPPPSPVEIADARAEADRIIAKTGAPDLFENVTKSDLPRVRHRPSGFVCAFERDHPQDEIRLLPGAPQGTAIACETPDSNGILTIFISKAPAGATVQQTFESLVAEIKRAHPDAAAPASGRFIDLYNSDKTRGPPRRIRLTSRLVYIDHGQKTFSRLSVAIANGWLVEQRLITPIFDDVGALDKGAEELIANAVDWMVGGPGLTSPPPAPNRH